MLIFKFHMSKSS